MRGDLQVEGQRREVMADGVVQLPGDAQPLFEAAPFREARLHPEREEREEPEAEVGRHQHQRGPERPVERDRGSRGERLQDEPRDTEPETRQPAELGRGEDQQHPFESVAEESDHHDDGGALQGEAAHSRRVEPGSPLKKDPKLATSWNDFGWTPLHLAAFSGSAETARFLLERGADLTLRAKTKFRNTPLQTALLPGQYETAKLLLEHGADPNVRQAEGFTPLQEAALLGRRDLVDLLLSHGAELNSRADDGRTALTEALRGKHTELADYLRSKGARAAEITADLAKPSD